MKASRSNVDATVSTGRTAIKRVPTVMGVVAVLLLFDLGVGLGWEHLAGTAETPPPTIVYDNIGISRPTKSSASDPRESLPALASYPWIHEWFQAENSAPRYYWPYLLFRNSPFKSRYLNIVGWERVSYRTPGIAKGDAPDVAVFGGSTTYGTGQRDRHTITSEVVRLAERDGLPIRGHNYGIPGLVNWQEMLLFEQFAAGDLRPDIAVFYDGANELGAQRAGLVGVPTLTAMSDVAERLGMPPRRHVDSAGLSDSSSVGLDDLWRSYVSHSVSGHVARAIRRAVDEPAGAEPSPADEPTAAEIDAMVSVLRRGRDLIGHVAEEHHVETVFFWQPRPMHDAEKAAFDRIGAPTIDISGVLDRHREVMFDGMHHNEEGSKIVAAAIWEHLRPKVEAWYRQHR